jgi:hypothetical protein
MGQALMLFVALAIDKSSSNSAFSAFVGRHTDRYFSILTILFVCLSVFCSTFNITLSTLSSEDKLLSYLQLKNIVKSKIGRDSPKNTGRVASIALKPMTD